MQVNPSIHVKYFPDPRNANIVTKVESPKNYEVAQMCYALEERLRAIKGKDAFSLDSSELCMVLNVVISPKFKVPYFEKYKGLSCPKTLLMIYSQDGKLSEAFKKHYHYNTDMAPTRTQLKNLTQKSTKSFKEYAQRWKELVERVQPLLTEKELVSIFMDTLHDPYWEKMSCVSS